MAGIPATAERFTAGDGLTITIRGRDDRHRRAGMIEHAGTPVGQLGSERFPTVAAVREHFGGRWEKMTLFECGCEHRTAPGERHPLTCPEHRSIWARTDTVKVDA